MWDACWVLVAWCAVAAVAAGGGGGRRLDSPPDLSPIALEEPASAPPRRITPKSVFVAPIFCSEGYRQDSLGRCVKVVRLNQAAQWDFFLQKLNAMYAEPAAPPRPDRSGPLHLHLPLESPATTTAASTAAELDESPTTQMTTWAEAETEETESVTTEATTEAVTATTTRRAATEETTTAATTTTTTTTTTAAAATTTTAAARCREGVGVSRVEEAGEVPVECDEEVEEEEEVEDEKTAAAVEEEEVEDEKTAEEEAAAEEVDDGRIRFPTAAEESERTRVRFPEPAPFWWPASWEVKRYPTSYQRLHHYHRRRRPQSYGYS